MGSGQKDKNNRFSRNGTAPVYSVGDEVQLTEKQTEALAQLHQSITQQHTQLGALTATFQRAQADLLAESETLRNKLDRALRRYAKTRKVDLSPASKEVWNIELSTGVLKRVR